MSTAFNREVAALRAARRKRSQLLARQAVVNAQLGAIFEEVARHEQKLEKYTGHEINDDTDLNTIEDLKGKVTA